MKQKEPLDFGLKNIEEKIVDRRSKYRFISSDFGFVDSIIQIEPHLFKFGQPYCIKEGRVALVKKGTARVSINLIEYTYQEGMFVLVAPNSIIQMNEISPDFDARMMAIHTDFLPLHSKEDFLSHLLHHKRSLLVTLSPEEHKQIEEFYRLMWKIMQENVFRREVIQHLLVSLLYNIEYIIKVNHQQVYDEYLTRQEDIFQRFISLVNVYSKTERTVGFYADKLCLTPRYLNTVIRQNSQQTVMDWINQSVIQEAKMMLKCSNLLIYQIADELNFPNPSFFCKFFKRKTGMTPQAYQRS